MSLEAGPGLAADHSPSHGLGWVGVFRAPRFPAFRLGNGTRNLGISRGRFLFSSPPPSMFDELELRFGAAEWISFP